MYRYVGIKNMWINVLIEVNCVVLRVFFVLFVFNVF